MASQSGGSNLPVAGIVALILAAIASALFTRVPLEVLGNGLCTDVLDAQTAERGRIEFEAGVVGREHQAACRAQQLQ